MSVAYVIKNDALVTDKSIEEHDISPKSLIERAIGRACAYEICGREVSQLQQEIGDRHGLE
jgi:hypothetical protein